MKAAVVDDVGAVPRYTEFPEPVPGDGDVLIDVQAVAVESIDHDVVAGRHFTASDFTNALPAIPCFDGVGTLADGTLVGFGGLQPPYGALAERVAAPEAYTTPIPEGVDPAVAVVLSSAMAGFTLRTAGELQPGQTVLVQGAIGVAGRLAVQVARKLGAGRVVATGRRDDALREVAALGADATIDTTVSDDDLVAAFRANAGTGYDVVLDFLWGRPAEVLFRALTPDELEFADPVRVIQVGASAGETVTLPADAIRASGVQLVGATSGLTAGTMSTAYEQVVAWASEGELSFATASFPLRDITDAWERWTRGDFAGRRLVIQV